MKKNSIEDKRNLISNYYQNLSMRIIKLLSPSEINTLCRNKTNINKKEELSKKLKIKYKNKK